MENKTEECMKALDNAYKCIDSLNVCGTKACGLIANAAEWMVRAYKILEEIKKESGNVGNSDKGE